MTSQNSTSAQSGLDILRQTEAERLALLEKIGQKRDSTVLTYFTSFRDGSFTSILDEDVRILERHIARVLESGAKNIDLFICTYGGAAVMPWNFYAMLRDYLPKARIGVIVPFEAYSAGTSISLGADELILGRSSVLGPTDTQMGRYDYQARVGVNDLSGFMWMLKDFDARSKLDDKKTLDWLTRNADPLVLGSVYRVWKENRRKVLEILGSRRKPLSQKDNEKIADYFLYEVGIHGQGIRRKEALAAGISFITLLEDTGLEQDVQRLFSLYADIMKLFSPFLREVPLYMREGVFADKNDVDIDGVHAGHTPLVMIESQFETNPAFPAYGYHRHWDVPASMGEEATPAPQPQTTLGEQAAKHLRGDQMQLSWGSVPRR